MSDPSPAADSPRDEAPEEDTIFQTPKRASESYALRKLEPVKTMARNDRGAFTSTSARPVHKSYRMARFEYVTSRDCFCTLRCRILDGRPCDSKGGSCRQHVPVNTLHKWMEPSERAVATCSPHGSRRRHTTDTDKAVPGG